MSPVTWRKIKVLLLISMTAVAEAQRVQEDIGQSHAWRSQRQGVMDDPSFQEQTAMADEHIDAIMADINFKEQVKRVTEQATKLNADLGAQEQTTLSAEQMRTLMESPKFQEQAELFAERLEEMVMTDPAQLKRLSEQMEAMLASQAGLDRQMKMVMGNRNFQEEATRAAKQIEVMKADPRLQSKVKQLGKQMGSMLPNFQERIKLAAEQVEAKANIESSEEQVKLLASQLEGFLADPNVNEQVGQLEALILGPNFKDEARQIEETLQPMMELFAKQLETMTPDTNSHGSKTSFARFLMSHNPAASFTSPCPPTGCSQGKSNTVSAHPRVFGDAADRLQRAPLIQMTDSHIGDTPSDQPQNAASGKGALRLLLKRAASGFLRRGGRSTMQAVAGVARAPWQGAKLKPLAMSIAVGLLIRFVAPIPASLTPQAWSLLAIFASTIAGIVTGPLPAPGVALCALTVGVMTGTFTFGQGVAAFSDDVIWLVVLAFFFAKAFTKTGLGDRIALNVVKKVGGTTLGVAYGLNAAEGIIASGMPSSAARAAGLFYPIVCSVAKATGSDPKDGTEKKTGAFLVQSSFQATGNSCSLWLFGAAQNLLALRLASQLGYALPSPFTTWLVANSLPALVAMILTPLVVLKALPPESKLTPDAPEEAKRRLKEMGPMKRDEVILGGTVLTMLGLWASSTALNIPPVNTAVMGLSVMLMTGLLNWGDCAGEKGAWTTMTWFAILVSMSAMLSNLGVVGWVADSISKIIFAAGLTTGPAFLMLLLLYSGTHYLFASQVAHLSALYVPFVSMMVKTGTPPPVAVLSLAVASNLFGSLTPYASAQAPVFFGGGYVTKNEWYKLGLLFMIFNHVVWLAVGGIWWKVLGLY